MKQLSITLPDQDVGSVFKAGDAESKSHIGVGREWRLEHLVIHFDDGCACLYLLHSINSFLSLLHPVCEGCTLLHYISSRQSRNIKNKKSRRTLITSLHVILHFKEEAAIALSIMEEC